MIKRNLSEEITSIFEYIKDIICTERLHVMVNEYAYVLAVLRNEKSLAYQALSSIVTEHTMGQMKDFFDYKITYTSNDEDDNKSPYSLFDSYIVECDTICTEFKAPYITSSILLLTILRKHEPISRIFRDFSITTNQLLNCVSNQISEIASNTKQVPTKHIKKPKKESLELTHPIKVVEPQNQSSNVIDHHLLNISKLASLGKISNIVNYDDYYTEVFTILSKKNKNNVVIYGKSGVGKTSFVKHMANVILNKKCHANFNDKIIVELDFSKLVVGTPFKGAFEQKFYAIVEEAEKNGNYIFFIDNLHVLLNGNTKYAETDIESLLEILFTNPSIQIICTMTEKAYGIFQRKSALSKYLQGVLIKEPSIDESIRILNEVKNQYETFHDVVYTEKAIYTCVELCSKYVANRALPDSALDLLDVLGAQTSIGLEENEEIRALKEELSSITEEISQIKKTSQTKEYETIDRLTREQIRIKSQIAIKEKETILSKEPSIINKNDVCSYISKKIDIPLEDLTQSEKTRLKSLNEKIKEKVVGQNEAVDEVCRVVKRQRVGLGDNNRPAVLMFLGSTGTGKTYLSKQLAKEVFGDDKYFVRMDMSEYADKTSVNKISGSSHGYVGYEDDTFLVSALKKKKRFVLLLDEFEKSSEEVHNIFLQMFDEGRFTDNHGEQYSLKDVIIILTSNVGVAEASNRGKIIGFSNESYDFSHTIIEKELKRKFKPEFINRIQKIVYFNKLNDTDLQSIIKLEVDKINTKVEKLGYYLSEDITRTTMINEIYETILSQKEYGARPIVNEVQRRIEDRIVDYLIENEVEKGHTFTHNELLNLDL